MKGAFLPLSPIPSSSRTNPSLDRRRPNRSGRHRRRAGAPPLGLIFGAADFSADLGATLAWEPLLPARSRIQLAAARSGLRAIDAPCFEVHDRAALSLEIDRTRRMGFAGKAALHPQQVDAINRGFTPGDPQIVRAREILAASERSHGEICVVRGEMIGPPGVRAARRLLGGAEAIAEREEVLVRREG